MISALWGLLVILVMLFWPVILVVVLVTIDNHKHNPHAVPSTPGPDAVPASTQHATSAHSAKAEEKVDEVVDFVVPPKPVDPYKKWNVLLYLGSFLLVIAMILFINNADSSLVAPSSIALTLIFYIGGLALFKLVPYLKSVGKSFAYTAAAVFPFWAICFISLGLSTQTSWIVASAISLTAFVATAALLESKVMATFAYLWTFVLAWSCTPSSNAAAVYWVPISSMLVSVIPTLIWLARPNWLPIVFRKATQVFGQILTPIVYIFTLVLFLIPDTAADYPYLRTIITVIMLAYALLHWLRDKKYGYFAAARFAAQALVFAIVADTLNYSLFTSINSANITNQLVAVIVWAASFLVQAVIALFTPKKNANVAGIERSVEVVSLIGIFITPILAAGFPNEQAAIIQLIIFSFVSILGVLYAHIHKNVRWTFATLFGLLLLPSTFGTIANVVSIWVYFAYYAVYGLLAIGILALWRKKQPREAFAVAMTGAIFASMLVLVISIGEGLVELGWLFLAIYAGLLGFLSAKKWLYEMAVYFGSFCLLALTGTVAEALGDANPSLRTENTGLTVATIQSLFIPGALLGVSCMRECGLRDGQKWRFILGYIILTISMLFIGWGGNGYWMLPSLIAQVGFLIYAVFKDRSWLVWTAISILVISVFSLTDGFSYIFFGVIGIILILIVVWRLTKLNMAKVKPGEAEPEVKEYHKKA